jgi:hypothetical protein
MVAGARSRSVVLAACVALAGLCGDRTALAQSQAPSSPVAAPSGDPPAMQAIEARSAFERGVEFARLERWAEALEEFRRSRTLVPRASAAINMASSLVRLGRAIEAVAAFDDYFRLVTDPAQEGARYAEAQRQLAITRETIAVASITVAPADATITVDGVIATATGAERQIQLDPRAHHIVVTAPRHEPYTVDVTPRQGERVTLVAQLRRIATSTLTVTATPRTATLQIDGRRVGLATPLTLSEGRHSLALTAPDHERSERWIDLEAGASSNLHVDLSAARPSIVRSPWLWTGVAAGVVAIAVVVALVAIPPPSYGGTTDIVVLGHRD